jgi:hypothetical protein
MFCPGCGLEEIQSNQFCRACGADLRMVRSVLERPDTITASAVSARDEIGRAIAAKIRETMSTRELATVAEDVLPEIEKFLESPQEKRMRRVRTGTTITSVGLGVAISFALLSIFAKEDLFVLAALGVVVFFLGLGFVVNGLLLTIPKKSLPDRLTESPDQHIVDTSKSSTNELQFPEKNTELSSVTEHTTRHLTE